MVEKDAFTAMVEDPEVLKEANGRQCEINQPMPGEEMAKLIGRLHAMPADAIKKAGDVIQRSNSDR